MLAQELQLTPSEQAAQDILVEAETDALDGRANWIRISSCPMYREALIHALFRLAQPAIGQRNINKAFSFGWCDPETGNSYTADEVF